MNNTHATSYDELSTKIIKLSAKHLACPLSYIINLSLEQGIFPTRLKVSVINPIFKKVIVLTLITTGQSH